MIKRGAHAGRGELLAAARRPRGQRMRRLAAVAAVGASFLATVPGVAAAAPIRECGNWGDHGDGRMRWGYSEIYGAGIFNLTTRRVWCSYARPFSYRFTWRQHFTHRFRFRGRTFRCRWWRLGMEAFDIRCTSGGGRVIRWQAGA